VREWKKERKVQIQAVGKEPNLLCKKTLKTLTAAVKTLIVAVTKYPLRFSSLGFHRNRFAPVFPVLKGCNHSTEAFNFPRSNVLTCAQGLEHH